MKRGQGWCAICGEKGHTQFRCPKVKPGSWGNRRVPSGERRDRVYQIGSGEEAVTVKVRIKGQEIVALLDTGAKPCVMDVNTLRKLGLENHMVTSPNSVFGLCSNPVKVIGYADIPLEVGGQEI